MRLSIALCTYNGSKYILDQLQSIASQTLKPYELVVFDDKSTDGTVDLLYSFRDKCPFSMRIYKNDFNVGIIKNFEKAVQSCKGDLIVMSDQDDVWKPDKLEKVAYAFNENPGIGYVFSDAELVDENLVPIGRGLWESIGFKGGVYDSFRKGDQLRCLLRHNVVTGATMAFRSSLKELALPFPANINRIHDGWIAVIASSTKAYGFPLPEKLILYRQHPEQKLGAPHTGSFSEIYKGIRNGKSKFKEILQGECSFCRRLQERLLSIKENYGIESETDINLIEDLIAHYGNRISINSTTGYDKIGLVYEELVSGRYRRYAYSWLSAFRDLVL
jgi:glycosyltransferase involved in cell wall biosynthesis